jgi:tetratricopeptide (TPR) repeat protein
LLKEKKYRNALAVLNEAIKKGGYANVEEIPPHYLSYFGLAMALAEKRFRNGAAFCEKAIKREYYNPVFYLNLGKVYVAGGYKRKAIDAFHNGLKIAGENIEIRVELKKIGVRHKPIIPFLPRAHVINKFLGLLSQNVRVKTS